MKLFNKIIGITFLLATETFAAVGLPDYSLIGPMPEIGAPQPPTNLELIETNNYTLLSWKNNYTIPCYTAIWRAQYYKLYNQWNENSREERSFEVEVFFNPELFYFPNFYFYFCVKIIAKQLF